MTAPVVDSVYFEDYTGLTLTEQQILRVDVLIDRARRAIGRELGQSFDWTALTADDRLDYRDAVSELAWFYWEAERIGAMEIIAQPVSQLSLGTLFWTKASGYGGPSTLANVAAVLRWKGNSARVVLHGDLEYPRVVP